MDVAGVTPSTNTLRPRTRAPWANLDELAERIPQTNRAVVFWAMAKKGSDEANARWGLFLHYAAMGWISDPIPRASAIAASWPLAQSCAISEFHGESTTPTILLIDYFMAPGVNDLLSSAGPCAPHGLGLFLSAVAHYKLLAPGCEMGAFS